MTKVSILTPQFVEFIPEEKRDGILYISIPYATASHRCCCGCGNLVVTPLTPLDWRLIFDGESVSLDPSIGNWSFPCQSHYWITENRVRWAPKWSAREMETGRTRERDAKERYFGRAEVEKPNPVSDTSPEPAPGGLRGWLNGLWPRQTK